MQYVYPLGASVATSSMAVEPTQARKWLGVLVDPGFWAAAAAGAAAAYAGSRSASAAGAGAMVGSGAILFAHMNAPGTSPLPMLLVGATAVTSGLYFVSRR